MVAWSQCQSPMCHAKLLGGEVEDAHIPFQSVGLAKRSVAMGQRHAVCRALARHVPDPCPTRTRSTALHPLLSTKGCGMQATGMVRSSASAMGAVCSSASKQPAASERTIKPSPAGAPSLKLMISTQTVFGHQLRICSSQPPQTKTTSASRHHRGSICQTANTIQEGLHGITVPPIFRLWRTAWAGS